jgi:hypothetical protein
MNEWVFFLNLFAFHFTKASNKYKSKIYFVYWKENAMIRKRQKETIEKINIFLGKNKGSMFSTIAVVASS